MKKLTSLVILFSFSIGFAQDIEIETFATGLSNPVNIKHSGDNRLFVAERSGYIQIINQEGTINPTPFLDIDVNVTDNGGEQGLLGLAFHPNYASNGYFYVNYINNAGDTVISRFTRSDSNTADSTSELILMTISQPYINHNGGDMAFGNDGYLYIATGDGGSGGDPGNRAQDLSTLLGKMLRIDVDNTSGGNNYAIPATNPFVGDATALDEIWSYGLRNPWKFSFDSLTNDIWIADVGQNEYEEINMVTPSASALGVNYGWRCYEGNSTYNTADCPPMAEMTFPVAEYGHTSSGAFKCSITGGYIYRGSAQPNLYGVYFFADYCSNEIGILSNNEGTWSYTFTEQYSGNGWSCFGEDVDGELYVAGLSSGTIYKIIDANLSVDEHQLSDIKLYPNPANESFTIDLLEFYSSLNSVHLFNMQGKLVKSVNEFDNQLTTISTKELSNGLYLVQLVNNNGQTQFKKLIVN
ncbi:T9SS type A sorting domain-containing protein [Flavobacteriaceae bacterium 144Ye]|nr:T9SS type A sorting domain-containing protein [Flavobacteriaceae bacterium 144Ye]